MVAGTHLYRDVVFGIVAANRAALPCSPPETEGVVDTAIEWHAAIATVKWSVCVHGAEMPNLLQLPDQ
jgi:hypothetical protein